MIDFGFSKLALICVVALIVIGPEKLPTVARMAGSLFGRAQRYLNDLKAEVSREIEIEELRKIHQEVQHAASHVGQSLAQGMSEVEQDLNSVWNPTAQDPAWSLSPDALAVKAKSFRKKRLARTSSVPAWYKDRQGGKTRVISGAARVAKYRRPASAQKSPSSFYP